MGYVGNKFESSPSLYHVETCCDHECDGCKKPIGFEWEDFSQECSDEQWSRFFEDVNPEDVQAHEAPTGVFCSSCIDSVATCQECDSLLLSKVDHKSNSDLIKSGVSVCLCHRPKTKDDAPKLPDQDSARFLSRVNGALYGAPLSPKQQMQEVLACQR